MLLLAVLLAACGGATPLPIPAECKATLVCHDGFEAATLTVGDKKVVRVAGNATRWSYECPGTTPSPDPKSFATAKFSIDWNGPAEIGSSATAHKGSTWLRVDARPDREGKKGVFTQFLLQSADWYQEKNAKELAAEIVKSGRARVWDVVDEDAMITNESKLKQVAAMLAAHPDWKVVIETHVPGNEPDSFEGAAAVADWLVENGVAKARLEPKGMGNKVPLSKPDAPDAFARNRRVEFVKTK